MAGNGTLFPLSRQRPAVQLIISLLIFLASSLLLIALLYASGSVLFSDWSQSREMLGEGRVESASPAIIRFLQAGQGICLFILPALLISYMMHGDFTTYMGLKRRPSGNMIAMVSLLAVFVIVLNTFIAWVNSRMVLPSSLINIEEWMRSKELLAERYTVVLTSSASSPNLAVNIFVVAFVAAFGEELFFRGVIQQLFSAFTKNGVLAVWITALLFSSIHMQFFGFFPRLLLGLVFGYLFLWSGSIWLPILAHFINNLIPVVIAYFKGWNEGSRTSEQIVNSNPLLIVTAFAVIVLLLYLIRKELKSTLLLKELQ